MEQKLEIDRLFSSHMVLQREKPMKVWGKCSGKEPVTVTFMGNYMGSGAAATGSCQKSKADGALRGRGNLSF